MEIPFIASNLWGLARYGLAVDFELRDIRPAARTMSAGRHQIHKTDFVNLAEVWICDGVAGGDAAFRIEDVPPDALNVEFVFLPIDVGAVSKVAYQKLAA